MKESLVGSFSAIVGRVKKGTVKSVCVCVTRIRSNMREGLEFQQKEVIVRVVNPRPFEVS